MDPRKRQYLQALGIDVWVRRETGEAGSAAPAEPPPPVAEAPAPTAEPSPADAPPPPTADTGIPVSQLDWDALRARVAGCRLCPDLAASRTQTVFGVGSSEAQWMIIGEAPGADEDRLGEPFVGRAGKLLDNMLRAVGLERPQVFIANVLKSRPPGNRDPLPQEVENCLPYLRRQIELIRPRLLVVVGRIAAQNLLGTDAPLGRLRGRVHRYGPLETPMVVTYHPAYLLRSPEQKGKAWADLRLALRTFREGEG